MARRKQATPLWREASDLSAELPDTLTNGWGHLNGNGKISDSVKSNGKTTDPLLAERTEQPGVAQLLICVTGIYVSFLTWAFLQERITTTPYGSPSSPSRFTFSVVLNTIQSAFAALTGYVYLRYSAPTSKPTPSIIPSRSICFPLVLTAITSSLASPFGYASLAHIDYITFILAKSCKLLPVMFLHLTIFRKRYPLYKYLVVALVTAGVAVFTLYHPSSAKKSSSKTSSSSTWGLFLLGINLLFDGLTNSTQDHIFTSFRSYTGPQMMVAQNILSTLLTTSYLLLCPILPLSLPASTTNELSLAFAFLRQHPAVLKDVLGFAACGAVGQIFIYYTLSQFSSLVLVTVTVTRKMMSMVLSVLWFGHRLGSMQWVGVALVFGGVGAEGWIQRREKMAKERARKAKENNK